ncbi:DUF5977 domain-containing protein [Chryseobacterium sp. MEBOG07]|uniref:DUF5977 domain-containing protein n=1 Tax=Chryseobacterium sp. MEBOG07 TaxID=2879939 RepID=UPI001F1F1CF7|nr:DUF5977 domain-containing protein [Chryseobacterium sp. MEBOG07]UKB80522.1 DUF5977 domain-containing protein [Chryseobacterium sp. MEBOG07]
MVSTFDMTNTPVLVKQYSYQNDDGKSSGILTYKDQSSVFVDNLNWFDGGTNSTTTTTSGYRGYYDEYVRYSKVREMITGKEKNDYYFTDLISNPDSTATKVHSSTSPPNTGPDLQGKLPLKVNKSNERGKLYKLVKYDDGMFALLTQKIKYTNFLSGANPVNEISSTCTTCKISDDRYYVEAKASLWASNPSNPSQLHYLGYYQYQPVLPYLPIAIETTEALPYQDFNGNSYTGGKLINREKYLKYNKNYLYWHPYSIETSENLPYEWNLPYNPPVYNGKIITKTYYPQDIIRNNSACITGNCPSDNDLVGGKLSVYKYMTDNNIVLPVIEGVLNKNNKVKLEENVYAKNAETGNFVKLNKRRASLLDSNFTLDNPASANVEEKESMELYDNFGNLLQSRNSNGIPTTTLYGYKQTLPIAEIKGATYSQVMSAYNLDPASNTSYLQLDIVSKSNLDTNEAAEGDLVSALDNFRLKPELKDFQISTFVYDPLIGIKSLTDANGKRQTYKYDGLNRPKKVVDMDGNLLKTYDYNFAPQRFYNDALYTSYKRSNCGPDSEGGMHGYIVPENKYFSTISKADANQKAQNEADINGAAEANIYGLCYTKSLCPFTIANNFVLLSSNVYSYYSNTNVVFKVTFRGYPINASYWNNEIKIGQMSGTCVPSVQRTVTNYVEPPGGVFGDTPANRTWNIRIDTAGNVYIKLISGSVGNNSANPLKFEFEY